ncbi:MAG: PEP-utilizing enzyme [Candidatus Woesearchaeota archaeon]
MNIKQEAYNRIKNTKWYKQGAEALPLYASFPGIISVYGMKPTVTQAFTKSIQYIDKKLLIWMFELKGLELVSHSIWNSYKNDSDFFDKLIKLFNEKEKILDNKILKTIDLDKLSDDELKTSLIKSIQIYEETWKPFMYIDSFDENWKEILDDLIKKNCPGLLTEEDIAELLLPEELSYIQEEELELTGLGRNPTDNLIEDHQKKYYWVLNNYSYIEELDAEYFREKLMKIKDPDKIHKELKDTIKNIIKRKNEIRELKKIPAEVLLFINLLIISTKLRDYRKRQGCKGNVMIKKHAVEISRRRNIPLSLLENIPYFQFLDKAFTLSKEELEKLEQPFLQYNDEDLEPATFYGKDAEYVYKGFLESRKGLKTDLKGMVACKGSAIGKVKIIMTLEEFPKMNKGDILVTFMTRPEYVPLLKKAAAIVTEEGGITSHAAIVSRELNIPCVIGVKEVTTILKDDDIIEVDAEKGVIRKVK